MGWPRRGSRLFRGRNADCFPAARRRDRERRTGAAVHRPLPTLLLPLLALAACGLPRVADGTLERVRGGTLRVGMVVDTPWVTDSAGGAGGVEAALVTELARRLQARPRWVRAPEARLMESLKSRDLDLVIGGLSAKSPYAKEIGLTRPYYTDTIAVGATAGARAPSS